MAVQALAGFSTPNLLLQTDLVFVPTVIIGPAELPPIPLFEGSFAVASTQNITLNNTGNTTVTFGVCAPSPSALHVLDATGQIPFEKMTNWP